MWASTRGAPPVVVVTWKRSAAMRPTTPSSMMKPDSFEHQPVAAFADAELGPAVDVDAVQELGRVGARRPRSCRASRRRRCRPGRAPPCIRGRPRRACPRRRCGKYQARFHSAHVLEDGAVRRGPAVDRRLARRGRTGCSRDRPAKAAEGDRRVGLAEGGEADGRHVSAQRLGRDAEGVHVRRLALVGRHAGGGVALDVLDRAEPLAHREADVLGGDVVLEVDEGLGGGRVAVGAAAAPMKPPPGIHRRR